MIKHTSFKQHIIKHTAQDVNDDVYWCLLRMLFVLMMVPLGEAEAAKFRETNKDLVQSITNVKNAVQILSKHNAAGASFLGAQ